MFTASTKEAARFAMWECRSDGVLIVLRCGSVKVIWSVDRFEMWECKNDGVLVVLRYGNPKVMEC